MKEKSCEVKFYQYNFKAISIISLVYLIPIIILLIANVEEIELYIIWIVLWMIFILPFLIFFYYRLTYYKKLQPTNIQEVILEKVESSWGRVVKFLIQMEIDGVKKNVNTLAVFTVSRNFGPNLIDNYSMRRALVGYDNKNDVAVVLKLLV